MTHPAREINESCWQCGKPADPSCTYIQVLNATSRLHADGHGYPVRRGRSTDSVRVSIPRCASCQGRRILQSPIAIGGVVVGLLIGASVLPLKGFGLGLGGMLGALTAGLSISAYERRQGRRLVSDYPPLVGLRKIGWTDPN